MKGVTMCETKETKGTFEDMLFLNIFQSFSMARRPGKLLIGLAVVGLIFFFGWAMDFSNTVVVGNDGLTTELDVYLSQGGAVSAYIEDNKDSGNQRGVFSTLWRFSVKRFEIAVACLFSFDLPGVAEQVGKYISGLFWAIRYHFWYSLVFFAIKLFIVSFAGGLICRMTALQFASGEKPGIAEAFKFSIAKLGSLFMAPVIGVGIILICGLLIFAPALLTNIPWLGEFIMAISMGWSLFWGAIISVLLIGVLAGFNLMYPAIAYDGSDCFDSLSRGISYVYSRPWRMGFYTTVAAVYGAISYTFVRFFIFLLFFVTRFSMELAVWAKDSTGKVNKLQAIWPQVSFTNLLDTSGLKSGSGTENLAALIVHIFLIAVLGLVISFVISFYFSANTIIYACLRKKIDDTAITEIYRFEKKLDIEKISEKSEAENMPEAPEE